MDVYQKKMQTVPMRTHCKTSSLPTLHSLVSQFSSPEATRLCILSETDNACISTCEYADLSFIWIVVAYCSILCFFSPLNYPGDVILVPKIYLILSYSILFCILQYIWMFYLYLSSLLVFNYNDLCCNAQPCPQVWWKGEPYRCSKEVVFLEPQTAPPPATGTVITFPHGHTGILHD